MKIFSKLKNWKLRLEKRRRKAGGPIRLGIKKYYREKVQEEWVSLPNPTVRSRGRQATFTKTPDNKGFRTKLLKNF